MNVTDNSIVQEMDRGQKLWHLLRGRRDTEPVSVERARLVTASWKETEGLPVLIRRAKVVEKIVDEIPIYIDDGQLLAGDYAARPMAAEWRPELEVSVIAKEIEAGEVPYRMREEDIPALKEVCEWWKNRGLMESFVKLRGQDEDFKRLYERSEDGAWVHTYLMMLLRDPSWFVPDFEKPIKIGLLGILKQLEEELKAISIVDEVSRDKFYLLRAMSIVLKAGMRYAARYSALAKELSNIAQGEKKR